MPLCQTVVKLSGIAVNNTRSKQADNVRMLTKSKLQCLRPQDFAQTLEARCLATGTLWAALFKITSQ